MPDSVSARATSSSGTLPSKNVSGSAKLVVLFSAYEKKFVTTTFPVRYAIKTLLWVADNIFGDKFRQNSD